MQSFHQKEKAKKGSVVAERKSSAAAVEVKTDELYNTKDCVYCGMSNHRFKNEHLNDHVSFVQQKNLCFRCLDGGHTKKNCDCDTFVTTMESAKASTTNSFMEQIQKVGEKKEVHQRRLSLMRRKQVTQVQ